MTCQCLTSTNNICSVKIKNTLEIYLPTGRKVIGMSTILIWCKSRVGLVMPRVFSPSSFLFSGYYVKWSSHITLVNQVHQDPWALSQWQPFEELHIADMDHHCVKHIMALIMITFTVLFKNMQTLKFKSQLTFVYFAAVSHPNGPLRKQNFTKRIQKVMVCDLWLVDFVRFCVFLCFKVHCL